MSTESQELKGLNRLYSCFERVEYGHCKALENLEMRSAETEEPYMLLQFNQGSNLKQLKTRFWVAVLYLYTVYWLCTDYILKPDKLLCEQRDLLMFDFARNRQCAVRSRIQLVAADPPTAIRCWDGCAWWSWRLCIGSPGQCEKAPVWQVSINVVLVGPRLKICLVVLEWPLLHCVELLSRHQNDPKSGFWGLTVMRFGQKRCGCRSTSIFRWLLIPQFARLNSPSPSPGRTGFQRPFGSTFHPSDHEILSGAGFKLQRHWIKPGQSGPSVVPWLGWRKLIVEGEWSHLPWYDWGVEAFEHRKGYTRRI